MQSQAPPRLILSVTNHSSPGAAPRATRPANSSAFRQGMAAQHAEKATSRHSDRSLRREESLFSWVSAKERFLASFGMMNQTSFSTTLQRTKEHLKQNSLKPKSRSPRRKP